MLCGGLEGQVTPFWLETSDNEQLFCWHVLPMDVYLEHERELVSRVQDDIVASDEFARTLGAKLLREDAESKLVINFHGVSAIPAHDPTAHGKQGLYADDTARRTQATSRSAGAPRYTAP